MHYATDAERRMTPPSTFPQAYGRLRAPVLAKCRRLLGQSTAAEDIAQETFTRLWQSGPRLDGTTDTRTIMAWLYVTSTRLALDALRQKRASVDLSAVEHLPLAGGSAPDEVLAARRSIAALAGAASAEELEAALLTRVDGLPQAEVATLLGVSERTLRRLLSRFDESTTALRRELAP
jgi:RNA polymerase sigma-70 factor, ECF subfamily